MKRTQAALRRLCEVLMVIALSFPTTLSAAGLVAVWGNPALRSVPPDLRDVKAVAAGRDHILALTAAGVAYGWGADYYDGRVITMPGVKAVAAGPEHILVLTTDGKVVAWGNGCDGCATVPAGLSNVTAIAGGGRHSLALQADGTVRAWGSNLTGQTAVPADLKGVISIGAGDEYSLALKGDGTVRVWGQLYYNLPAQPTGLSNIIAIAAGAYHALALKSDGTVFAWGNNIWGQLNVPPGTTHVVAIAAGQSHSLALKADGTVVAWGENAYGATSVPAGLVNATAIAAGSLVSLAVVPQGPIQIRRAPESEVVLSGNPVTFSIETDGWQPMGYTWHSPQGILVDNNRVTGSAGPSVTISNIIFSDAGHYFVVVTNPFGSVTVTGAMLTVMSPPIVTHQPADTTLGAGSALSLSVSVGGTLPFTYQWLYNGTALPGANQNKLVLTDVQPAHSGLYAVVVSNQYGWAQSESASVTITNQAPYIYLHPQPQALPLGGFANLTVKASGSVPFSYQWRLNGQEIPRATNSTLEIIAAKSNQTGYYSVTISNIAGESLSRKAYISVSQAFAWTDPGYPVFGTYAPSHLANLVAVSAGYPHTLGLTADGTVVSWTYDPRVLPFLTNVPAGLGKAAGIAAGEAFSLALRENGTVVAWGRGVGTNVPPNLSNVVAVAAGASHGLALGSDGTVAAWGSNSHGQVNVPAGLSNVVSVAGGWRHSVALRADSTVVAWGARSFGQTNVPPVCSNAIAVAAGGDLTVVLRPDGTVTNCELAFSKQFRSLSNVVAVAAGSWQCLALKSDGTVEPFGVYQDHGFSKDNIWHDSYLPLPPGLSNVFAVGTGGPANFSDPRAPTYFLALVGNGSPSFTVHPFSQTMANGNSLQLHARAVGIQPIQYQWQFDGHDIQGATNASLTFTSVEGRNAGAYRVTAANALGVSTSRTAFVEVPYSGTLAEALNATNWHWITFGNAGMPAQWFAQNRESHDGAAAQSGPVTHGQTSVLWTTVVGPGTLSFWWKASTEAGYDFLTLEINGAVTPQQRISGETGWEHKTFSLSAGTHSLRWAYAKDASVTCGRDAVWIDQVRVISPPALTTPGFLANGRFSFCIQDVHGDLLCPEDLVDFEVEVSTNLLDWSSVSNIPYIANGARWVVDSGQGGCSQRFYRLVDRQVPESP